MECQLMQSDAEQGCSNTELRIVSNSNKLVYLTVRITAHRSTNLRSYTSTPGISRNFKVVENSFQYFSRLTV